MFLNTIRNYFLPGCDVEKDEHGNAYSVMAMAEIVGETGNFRALQGILGLTGNFRGATENSR